MSLGLFGDLSRGGDMWVNFPIFGGYDDRSDIAFNSEDLINLFLIGDPQGKKQFAFAILAVTEKEIG